MKTAFVITALIVSMFTVGAIATACQSASERPPVVVTPPKPPEDRATARCTRLVPDRSEPAFSECVAAVLALIATGAPTNE